MSESVKNRLWKLIYGTDLIMTRVTLGLAEVIWSIALIWPGATFSRSRTYGGMAAIASEELWALIWGISGFIQLYLVWKEDYHSRQAVVFSAFNATLWVAVTTSLMLWITPPNAVASADIACAVMAVIIFIRSGYIPRPVREVLQ